MVELKLEDKFPTMTPIRNSPSLFTLNGFGFCLYGGRDHDVETGTYIKTWCLSLLFLPVLCLRSYRVADAENGGWYFLGREPLSAMGRIWNLLVVLAIAGIIGGVFYVDYTASPGYEAKQRMALAHQLADDGDIAHAAKIYQRLAQAGKDQSRNATEALGELLDGPCAAAPLDQCAKVCTAAARVTPLEGAAPGDQILAKGLAMVDSRGAADPAGAVAVLDAIRSLAVDTRPLDDRRGKLLEEWVAADPDSLDAARELASLLSERGEFDRAEKLLIPFKPQLRSGEGARVLGQVLAGKGDFDAACKLLQPYVENRLDALHNAAQDYDRVMDSLWNREIRLLDKGKGPNSFYRKYNKASEARQQALVQEYIHDRIKDDPRYVSTSDQLEKAGAIVPVAMDLGMVMLQRAQGQADPAVRRKQLQETEKVFLSIADQAGESAQYRLSLGKVKYWLGKQAEGKKLFDEFLTANKRSTVAILAVASAMRSLGDEPEARKLAENAYSRATEAEEKNSAASFRSVCFIDLDDRITWLRKCNTSAPATKADLADALGNKAMSEGRDAEAEEQFRKAIEIYQSMPRSSSSLNESARAWLSIHSITGDRKALDRRLDLFQQALELSPRNPILLGNTASVLQEAALADIIGSRIDLCALRQTGGIGLLSYLYRDEAGRDAMTRRVKQHPGVARVLEYFNRLIVLAPNSYRGYAWAATVHNYTRDEAALAELEKRVAAATFDHSDDVKAVKKYLSGARDDKAKVQYAATLKRADKALARTKEVGGPTLAVALCGKVFTLMSKHEVCGDTDANEVVALAEQAEVASPSSATHSARILAYLFRASKTLSETDTDYAAFYKKYHRPLSIPQLLATAASQSPAMRDKIFSNTDVKRAFELIHEKNRQFPNTPNLYAWALLRHADPAEADRLAKIIRANRRLQLVQSIEFTLSPTSATTAQDMAWLKQIHGDEAAARRTIRKTADLGIPIPPLR